MQVVILHNTKPFQNHNYFLDNINKGLDVYSTYERVELTENFNAQVGENLFETLSYQHELTSINKNPACCKTQISLVA